MSHEVLVKNALKRQEAFKNLEGYLRTIKDVVRRLDSDAETYIFGSVAEGRYNFSSDIDILVITRLHPAEIHSELWKAGIKEPFEIHVEKPERASSYKTRMKLLEI